MRWTFRTGLALIAAMTISAPAAAERIELREKDFTGVDPTKSYVLIESEVAGPVLLFRRASAEEKAKWQVKYEKAFAAAKRTYQIDLRDYEEEKKSRTGPRMPKPVPPEDGFYKGPPELKNFVTLTGRTFVKGEKMTLLQLQPGEYVFYTVPGGGPGVAAQGQCLCMGTIAFTAEAGKIVSVGRLDGMERRQFRFTPADAGTPIPAALKSHGVTLARLTPVGKLPNFFGSIVTRVAAIPGLIDYRRDEPIDGAGAGAAGLD